jgi:two-component system sensor kinase FixL
MVIFSVADTGMGILQKNLANVMEPLFSTKARGMGLGLPITRSIVEKNKGTLSFTSELDKGSRFSISLKIAHNPE